MITIVFYNFFYFYYGEQRNQSFSFSEPSFWLAFQLKSKSDFTIKRSQNLRSWRLQIEESPTIIFLYRREAALSVLFKEAFDLKEHEIVLERLITSYASFFAQIRYRWILARKTRRNKFCGILILFNSK